jgi:hypothetical protein
MWWKDFQLKWSHMEKYNHIYSIRVPFDMVWTPDIVLFNKYFDYFSLKIIKFKNKKKLV